MSEKIISSNKKIKIKSKGDWHKLNFDVPIESSFSDSKSFKIRGTAINATTTRNNITFLAEELEKSAHTLKGKPLLRDHSNSVNDLIGIVEEAIFNPIEKRIEFVARIEDEDIKSKVNSGILRNVSIGAIIEDIEESVDEESGREVFTAIGISFCELSTVCVPGDPNADFTKAIFESFKMKKEGIDDEKEELEKSYLIKEKEDKMEKVQEEKTKVDEAKLLSVKLKKAEEMIATLEAEKLEEAKKAYAKLAETKNVKALDVEKMTIETVKVLSLQLEEVEEPKEEETKAEEEDDKSEGTEKKPEAEPKSEVSTETDEVKTEEELSKYIVERSANGFTIMRK